jgi:hypothetical protein
MLLQLPVSVRIHLLAMLDVLSLLQIGGACRQLRVEGVDTQLWRGATPPHTADTPIHLCWPVAPLTDAPPVLPVAMRVSRHSLSLCLTDSPPLTLTATGLYERQGWCVLEEDPIEWSSMFRQRFSMGGLQARVLYRVGWRALWGECTAAKGHSLLHYPGLQVPLPPATTSSASLLERRGCWAIPLAVCWTWRSGVRGHLRIQRLDLGPNRERNTESPHYYSPA